MTEFELQAVRIIHLERALGEIACGNAKFQEEVCRLALQGKDFSDHIYNPRRTGCDLPVFPVTAPKER